MPANTSTPFEVSIDLSKATLKEQLAEFDRVNNLTEKHGAKLNTYFALQHNVAKQRIADGDDEPLKEGQYISIDLQLRMCKAAAENNPSSIYASEDEKVPEEESFDMALDYIPATVNEDVLVFAEGDHNLTWMPNPGLEPGSYMTEIRYGTEEGALPTLSSARQTVLDDSLTFMDPENTDPSEITSRRFTRSDNSIIFPVTDPLFHMEQSTLDFFNVIVREAQFKPQKVMITGPQGTGKTSFVQQIAARHDMGFFQMSCGMVETPAEWFGYRTVIQGPNGPEVSYIQSAFIEACQRPNTVILLDEFNRLHSSLANGLYNILDDNGTAWIDYLKQSIHVATNVIFVATCNIGVAHTGTFAIDSAMEDRFSYTVNMPYMEADDETRVLQQKTGIKPEMAKLLVRLATQLRDEYASGESIVSKPISFRQLETIATLIRQGMTPRVAAEFTILPRYSTEGNTDSENATVRQLIQGVFFE